MARKQTAEDTPAVFPFPYQGVDLTSGRNFQRPGTTPSGNNVRAFAALDLRRSGGSRAGITPLFGAGSTTQVSGTHLVQHLNQIVWITRLALSGGANAAIRVSNFVEYSEVDHPPSRDSPIKSEGINWFVDTQPEYTIVSDPVVGTPDGGGTGIGTAKFKLADDGTTVTLTATFVSAGFPPPLGGYVFVGRNETFQLTLTEAQWNAGIHFSAFWTAVDFVHGYVAQFSFDIFKV